ncbi:hypothetical protein [Streptacidiphilus jiangxiensis]|uniref:Uncharacterized protein n=1 Tax=Streptacidiphilus jiangxiensis TaxID=235985 RepID=A0A1H7FF17_STRJI|nr:hypothetical protein [Streptacidiphilus jiangxiensis]SEK24773.1 hypothetical protein SAMN05414137_101233 [Streptacidiphilus jiangxiensis]
MYGPPPPVMSPAPPARSVGVLRVGLWVLVAVALVGGVGIFAFIPLTVLAARSRGTRDLVLVVASFVFSVVSILVTALQHDPNHPTLGYELVALAMLLHGIVATIWFVVSDLRHLRHLRALRQVPPFPSPFAPPVPPPYAPSFAPPPVQQDRLGQVRAELDELSDYLRREQGR